MSCASSGACTANPSQARVWRWHVILHLFQATSGARKDRQCMLIKQGKYLPAGTLLDDMAPQDIRGSCCPPAPHDEKGGMMIGGKSASHDEEVGKIVGGMHVQEWAHGVPQGLEPEALKSCFRVAYVRGEYILHIMDMFLRAPSIGDLQPGTVKLGCKPKPTPELFSPRLGQHASIAAAQTLFYHQTSIPD
eukprot:1137084-Pelagomonas_calceolata.AAC.4